MNVVVLLAKNVMAPWTTMVSHTAIDVATQRKMLARGVVIKRERITLVISNEDWMILLEL